MHEKSVINIEWLVKNIEQLMANHSPIEAMYTDVFQSFDIDIPVESNTEQWMVWIENHHMNYDDFICNILMAVLSELCADISLKSNNYIKDLKRAWNLRRKKMIATKEKSYGKNAEENEYQQYFNQIKQKNLSLLFHTESLLLLHEIINEDEGCRNPLLKLAASDNINLEHFSGKDLDKIIQHYKDICQYITESDDITLFQEIIILYHLEIETRFSTIFQILHKICDAPISNKNILYHLRGICSAHITDTKYQNIIYFNKSYYIDKLSEYCCQEDIKNIDEILSNMYEMIKIIYVIRDTVINDLQNELDNDYINVVNDTFTYMNNRIFLDSKLLPHERKLLNELENLKNEYNSFNSYQIKLDHFIRMYVSDDRIEQFQQSELQKKRKKTEHRKNSQ